MNKKFILVLIFGMVLISLVFAQPPTFNQFYGFIFNESGDPIETNVQVTAYINGSLVGSVQSVNDTYGYTDLFFAEGGIDGQIISFYVDSYFSLNYSFFEHENVTQLDLTLNYSAPIVCVDIDNDGYGDPASPSCVNPELDCNDASAAINPGMVEVCGDGLDNDCSGGDAVCDDGDSPNGGSPSGGDDTRSSFTISKTNVSLTLVQGETQQFTFVVNNTGGTVLDFTLAYDSDMLSVENSFRLLSGQTKTVTARVSASETQVVDLYVGHINITTSGVTRQILVAIEVVTKENIFDMVLEVPEDYLYVLPDNEVSFNVFLTKLIAEDIGMVTINYEIRDEDGNVILSDSGEVDVNDVASFSKKLLIPAGTPYGKYVLYSQIPYDDKIASSSVWFNIGPKSKFVEFSWIIIAGILILIILVILAIFYFKRKRTHEDVRGLGLSTSE